MQFARRNLLKAGFAAAACAVLALGAAHAAEDPIPLIDVVVEKVPPGNAFAYVTTDKDGIIAFRSLEEGGYRARDRAGENSASIKHAGGPARWRLVSVKSARDSKSTWALQAVSGRE